MNAFFSKIDRSGSVSLFIHPFVYYLFISVSSELNLPAQWRTQFLLVLSSCLIISIIQTYAQHRKIKVFLLFIRFLLYLYAGYPLGNQLLIKSTLLISVFFDIYFLFSPRVSFFIILGLTIIGVFIRQPVLAWDIVIPQSSIRDKMTVSAYLLGINVFLYYFNLYRIKSNINRELIDKYENSVQKLIDVNLHTQETTINEIERALGKERKRIARDIHDIVGHSMVNIAMLTESLTDKIDQKNENVSELLRLTREQAEVVLKEMEASLTYLKNSEIERTYDIAAVKRLIDLFIKATGVSVQVEFRNSPLSFGTGIDRIVYRVIQECMTNALRHGNATEIVVLFWKGDNEMEISIQDNGTGAKNIKEGVGLWGIKERISSIGGGVSLRNNAIGFEVEVRFPLEEA